MFKKQKQGCELTTSMVNGLLQSLPEKYYALEKHKFKLHQLSENISTPSTSYSRGYTKRKFEGPVADLYTSLISGIEQASVGSSKSCIACKDNWLSNA